MKLRIYLFLNLFCLFNYLFCPVLPNKVDGPMIKYVSVWSDIVSYDFGVVLFFIFNVFVCSLVSYVKTLKIRMKTWQKLSFADCFNKVNSKKSHVFLHPL